MHPIVLIILIDVILVAPLSAWLADQKGRSPSGWFVAAAIAGPIAFLALGLAPPSWVVEEARRRSRRCERCDAPVSLQARHCPTCGTELPPAPAPEPEREPAPTPEPIPVAAAATPVVAAATPGRSVVARRPGRQREATTAVEAPPTTAAVRSRAAGSASATAAPVAAPAAETPQATAPWTTAARAAALGAAATDGRSGPNDRRRRLRGGAAPDALPSAPDRTDRPEAAPRVADEIGVADAVEELDEAKVDDLSRRRGVENVATGVFAGGVSELGAGYRYLISVSPRMLYVSGPVDVAPHHVVFRAPRAEIDATLFDNDLVIVAESPNGRKRNLVFRGIAGSAATNILALLDRDRQPVARRRSRKSGDSPG